MHVHSWHQCLSRRRIRLLQNHRHPYFVTRQVFSDRQIAQLLLPGVFHASHAWEPATFTQLEAETKACDAVNRVSALELQTYMLSTLLRDTDQMSMAHALEVRVPLLDHRLVEYRFTLPGECKLEPGQPKPLLSRSLNGAIPRECVHRPKRGFELPLAVWLRESLEAAIKESLLGQAPEDAAPFSADGLADLWFQFESRCLTWSRVWGVFVLRNWLGRHEVTL